MLKPAIVWHNPHITIRAGTSWLTLCSGAKVSLRGAAELAVFRDLLWTARNSAGELELHDPTGRYSLVKDQHHIRLQPAGEKAVPLRDSVVIDLGRWLRHVTGLEANSNICVAPGKDGVILYLEKDPERAGEPGALLTWGQAGELMAALLHAVGTTNTSEPDKTELFAVEGEFSVKWLWASTLACRFHRSGTVTGTGRARAAMTAMSLYHHLAGN